MEAKMQSKEVVFSLHLMMARPSLEVNSSIGQKAQTGMIAGKNDQLGMDDKPAQGYEMEWPGWHVQSRGILEPFHPLSCRLA